MATFNIELRGRSKDRNLIEDLSEIGPNRLSTLKPACQTRWKHEFEVYRQDDLVNCVVELQQLAHGLREVGHRLQVVGSATSSMVLHAMGLSPLCPTEHGFHFERFLDPSSRVDREFPLTGLVSMTGLELLQFLWKHDYTTRVFQHETKVNGELQKLEHIGARHEGEHGDGPRLILQIVTPSDLAIVNLLSAEQIENCLHDASTWELIGRGETSGIANLDNPGTQKMLRERRPKSLAKLAAVMISQSPGREEGGSPDYQEDLMSELYREAGLSLREAYELIRTAARNKPDQLKVAAENLLKHTRTNGIEEDAAIRMLKSIQAKSPHALCKAHIYTTAHLALQTAYVKALHPGEFQAFRLATMSW
jgi:hypothetical protein